MLVRIASFIGKLGNPHSRLPGFWIFTSILFAVQLSRSIHDVDIFWQLKLGEIIRTQGIPSHEPFLADKDADQFVPIAWLAQVLYSVARSAGGWPLLRFVDAAFWFAGFVVVARSCRNPVNHWPAAVGLYVGWFAAIAFASVRPQSLALFAFGLLMILVRSNISTVRKVILGGLLLLFWQNCHPSVIIAVVYLAARGLGELLTRFRHHDPHWPITSLLLLGGAVTVMPLTPAGFKLFPLASYNAQISRELGVSEWQPLFRDGWPDWDRADAWVAITLTLLWVFFTLRSQKASDLLPVLVLTAMTLLSHRFIVFWGIAVIPVWAGSVATAAPRPGALRTRRTRGALVFVAATLASAIPLTLWPAPFAEYYPFAAVQALKQHSASGVIYCNFFWGGVISDYCYPGCKVTHDGRYYLFDRKEWRQYYEASRGMTSVSDLEQRHHPDWFLLRFGSDDRLIQRLRSHESWKVVFEDQQSILFSRR